jgi:hypothetical protein
MNDKMRLVVVFEKWRGRPKQRLGPSPAAAALRSAFPISQAPNPIARATCEWLTCTPAFSLSPLKLVSRFASHALSADHSI